MPVSPDAIHNGVPHGILIPRVAKTQRKVFVDGVLRAKLQCPLVVEDGTEDGPEAMLASTAVAIPITITNEHGMSGRQAQ